VIQANIPKRGSLPLRSKKREGGAERLGREGGGAIAKGMTRAKGGHPSPGWCGGILLSYRRKKKRAVSKGRKMSRLTGKNHSNSSESTRGQPKYLTEEGIWGPSMVLKKGVTLEQGKRLKELSVNQLGKAVD